MFHVEVAPLGGILGPLKSDLGVFRPFRAIIFINIKFAKRLGDAIIYVLVLFIENE